MLNHDAEDGRELIVHSIHEKPARGIRVGGTDRQREGDILNALRVDMTMIRGCLYRRKPTPRL